MKHVGKRILALVLTLAMFLSMSAVSLAAEPAVVSLSNADTVVAGSQTTFTVSIGNNPGIAGFTLSWKVVDSNGDDATAYFTHTGNWLTATGILKDPEGETLGDTFTRNGVNLNWNASENISGDGALCTMKLAVDASIVNGQYTISLNTVGGEPTNFCDTDGAVPVTFQPYTFEVTGGIDPATLTPAITTQPQSADYTYGDTPAALSVAASVQTEGTLSYQWYKGGIPITGATGTSYTPMLSAFGSASYTCKVTNTYNGRAFSTTSTAAVITYNKATIGQLKLTPETAVYTGKEIHVTASIEGLTRYSDYDLTVNSLSGTAVGTYTVTATGKVNYQGTSTATWSITPAEITIDGSQTMTIYTNGKQFDLSGAFTATTVDGTTPTITYTTADTGLINLTSDGKVTAITTGKATVTATVRAANHNEVDVPITVTILDKNDVSDQIAFSAKDPITYDGAAHKLSELVNAATCSAGSGTITYKLGDADATLDTEITDAGTYTVTAYYEDDTHAGSKSVTVTINPKPVAVPSAKTGLTYTGAAQTGVEEGEGYTLTGNTGVNADSYTATAKLAKNYIWSDSTTGDKSIVWMIAKQPITVVLSNIKWDYTAPFTYDGTAKTVSITSGVPDTVNAAQSGAWSATNAGSYTATVTFTSKDDNYVVTEASKTTSLNWKIEQATVTVPTEATGLKYDGQPKTGVAAGDQYTVANGTAADAGSYTAQVTLNDPANYKWATTFDGNIEWSIAQADAQKLTAEKPLRYSNTAPQTLTAADITLADAKDITIKSVSTASNTILSADAALVDGVVSYQLKSGLTAANDGDTAKITVTFSSKNYADSTLELTVKVIQKNDVSGGVAFAAASVTRTYTGAAQTLETATYNGAASDKITYSYSSTPKDVGTYTVTATYEDDDNIGTATATLKIDPAKLTITGATAADKYYDGSTAAAVSDVTFSGLVNDETLSASDYTVSNAAFANANAGTGKPVTFTVTLATTGTAKNYVLTSATGSTTAAINPARVTVTVADIAAVTYDGQPKTPALTVKASETSLTAGTDYTVEYANNTNAGTASATVKEVSGGNYTFADVTKDFTINKAAHADIPVADTVFSDQVVTGEQTKSVDLSAQIAGIAGATYGEPTKGEGSMITDASMSDKQLTITYTPSAADTKQTVTIPVTADNYNDFAVVVTFTAIDKTDVSAQITFSDKTVIWNGAAQSLDAATFGGSSANMTYKIGDGAFGAMPSFTDAGTYTVTARYEDAKNLGYATATLTITNKIDLTVKATNTTDEELLKILVNNGLYTVTGVTNAADKNETTAAVKGTRKLASYLSTDPGQQDAAHQWIGLLIGTTLNGAEASADSLYYSADGVTFSKLDEIEFTDAVVHGGTGNEFVLWMKTDVDKTLTRYIATLADGSDAVKLTIEFTPYKSSSSGSSGSSLSYSITIADKTPDGGKISVSEKSAKRGDTVTITVTPDKGCVLDELIVTDKNGDEIKLKDKGNGKFTFTMPASKVKIEATFEKEAPQTPADNTIVLTIGSPVATVFGEIVVNDVAPLARNNRTLLPIRFVAEALGATVDWNADLQKVTIEKADLLIELYLGQTTAYVNGQPIVLDVAAFAENNRTYLPLRFIAENLGATVLWDQPTQTVTIIG